MHTKPTIEGISILMPISLAYDTRDAVPEALKDHVAEKDGKFIFEAEPVSVVTQTNEKLKKLRGDLDAKTAKLGKFAKLDELGDDLDIDDLLSLRELKKQGKPLTADEKAEHERQLAKLTTKQATELKAREDALSAANTELKHFKLTSPLKSIALKSGVLAEDLDVVMLETQGRWKLGEDGKKIIFLDNDGDEDVSMTPEKFYGEIYKKLRPKFYTASGAGGSGAGPASGGGNGGVDYSKLNATERLKAARNAGITT